KTNDERHYFLRSKFSSDFNRLVSINAVERDRRTYSCAHLRKLKDVISLGLLVDPILFVAHYPVYAFVSAEIVDPFIMNIQKKINTDRNNTDIECKNYVLQLIMCTRI